MDAKNIESESRDRLSSLSIFIKKEYEQFTEERANDIIEDLDAFVKNQIFYNKQLLKSLQILELDLNSLL